jgi:hypothetical protein
VTSPQGAFDYHQVMAGLEVSKGKVGVTAQWSEPLRDRDGATGGRTDFRLSLSGEVLEVALKAKELVGAARVDYHVLHRPTSSAALWAGDEVKRIAAGQLPETGGNAHVSRTFEKGRPARFAVQVDNSVLGLEVVECPADSKVTLGELADNGLHAGNHGGFRLRFEVPAGRREFALVLRMRKLNAGRVWTSPSRWR